MDNNEKKKFRLLKTTILLSILVVIIALVGYAWARYVSQDGGTATAQIAKWSFKVNGTDSSSTDEIAFAITRTDSAPVEAGTVAPGTKGYFEIDIDTSDAEVAIQYDIYINLTNWPHNMHFYKDSAQTQEFMSSNNVIDVSRYVAIADLKKAHNHIIYWEWPFETGTIDPETGIAEGDYQDSQDMLNPVSMTITVTGVEAMGIPNTDLKDAILNTGKISIEEGETSVISITNLSELGNLGSITYSSSDDTIVTVDSNGTVTGVSRGNAIITLTETNGSTVTVNVEVKNKNYEELSGGTHIKYYETLKEAVDNASSGSTIKVLKSTNETLTPHIKQDKKYILDLNGNNVTLAQDINLINNGLLTIQGSGTLTSTIQNMNGGTLVIAGASITSSGTRSTIANYSESTVRMTSGSISSTNRIAIEMTSGEVTITGGTVEGERCGIYNNRGTITIGDETQIGDSTIAIVKGNTRYGVFVGSGTLNFNGGKIQTESSSDEAIDGTATIPEGYDVLVTTLGTTKQVTVSPTYTLTLDPKGGTIPTTSGWTISTNGDNYQSASKIVTYGATYGELPTPARTGYTFRGWYSAIDLNDITIAASTTSNNNYKVVEYNIKPGVTYILSIGNAELTEGTATQFTALIYDQTNWARVTANVNTDFGTGKTITLTCPSTADGSHKLQILLYAGVQGSTANNAVKFENIKIGTIETPTQTEYTSSSIVSTASNHVLYAQWIANSAMVSTPSKIEKYGKLPIPTIGVYTLRKRYN